MAIQTQDELSAREREMMMHDKEMWEKGAEQQLRLKDREIALATLEAKWSSWLRLPKYIILLPVYLLMGIAFCIAVARKFELGQNFWRFLK